MFVRSTQDSQIASATASCSGVSEKKQQLFLFIIVLIRGNRIRDEGLVHIGEGIAELPELE